MYTKVHSVTYYRNEKRSSFDMTINTKVEQTKGKPGDREHHHSQFGGYFVSEMIFI